MSLGNDDNKDRTDDDPELRMPYRKRKRFYETVTHTTLPQPRQKWREACYRAHPNLDSLPQEQIEAIESHYKVEYYIALGLDSSLPRTATSGSIETPKVSPLILRPPRVPSRASTVPATPARPIEPMGPLPPLTLPPSSPLHSQLSCSLPAPTLAPPSTLSPYLHQPPLSPGPMSQQRPTNPYLSSFYGSFEKPLITMDTFKPLSETFVKSEEEPILKSDRNTYLNEEKPFRKSITPLTLDDCFIKPIHPVSKPYKDPFLDPPKKTYSTCFTETSMGDKSLKRTASSSSYWEAAEPLVKKPKGREAFFEPDVEPFKTVSTTQPEKGPVYLQRPTFKHTSGEKQINPYQLFEPIKQSPWYMDTYIKTEDPFSRKQDPLNSFYSPSTSASSVPKFGRSSSIYVDCPSIYPTIEYIDDIKEEINNNNNNDIDSNNNNEENDEPIDYSINHLSGFQH